MQNSYLYVCIKSSIGTIVLQRFYNSKDVDDSKVPRGTFTSETREPWCKSLLHSALVLNDAVKYQLRYTNTRPLKWCKNTSYRVPASLSKDRSVVHTARDAALIDTWLMVLWQRREKNWLGCVSPNTVLKCKRPLSRSFVLYRVSLRKRGSEMQSAIGHQRKKKEWKYERDLWSIKFRKLQICIYLNLLPCFAFKLVLKLVSADK